MSEIVGAVFAAATVVVTVVAVLFASFDSGVVVVGSTTTPLPLLVIVCGVAGAVTVTVKFVEFAVIVQFLN